MFQLLSGTNLYLCDRTNLNKIIIWVKFLKKTNPVSYSMGSPELIIFGVVGWSILCKMTFKCASMLYTSCEVI